MRRFKIMGPDGRFVSYLKRCNHGVAVYFPGSRFSPQRRGSTPAYTVTMSGEASYPEKIAKGWISSLTKAGYDGFKIIEEI